MTAKRTGFSGVFSLLYWVLRACGAGLRRGASAVLRGLYKFILISGSNPALSRDPGIAAYRLLEGHPQRSRPFRESAVTAAGGVPNEPHLQFGAFL